MYMPTSVQSHNARDCVHEMYVACNGSWFVLVQLMYWVCLNSLILHTCPTHSSHGRYVVNRLVYIVSCETSTSGLIQCSLMALGTLARPGATLSKFTFPCPLIATSQSTAPPLQLPDFTLRGQLCANPKTATWLGLELGWGWGTQPRFGQRVVVGAASCSVRLSVLQSWHWVGFHWPPFRSPACTAIRCKGFLFYFFCRIFVPPRTCMLFPTVWLLRSWTLLPNRLMYNSIIALYWWARGEVYYSLDKCVYMNNSILLMLFAFHLSSHFQVFVYC